MSVHSGIMKKGKKAASVARLDATGTLSTSAPAHLLSTATREQVTQYAMLHSITTGTFEDVKFYLFSRRTSSGRVDTPRALYGNRALICKASPHFEFVFSAGFAESGATDMDGPFPLGRASYSIDYDYTADSDFEDGLDDESDNESDLGTTSPAGRRSPVHVPIGGSVQGRSAAEDVVEEPSVSKETNATTHRDNAASKAKTSSAHPPEAATSTPSTSFGRKGHVVFIEDIAYKTWEAFIFYAYFGTVSFSPLKSRGSASATPRRNLYEPSPCSPKSMYRLAEKYGIDNLKELAIYELKNQMAAHIVLTELFSPFAMIYVAVQDAELDYLCNHIKEEEVLKQTPAWFRALEEGSLPHGSAAIFSKLLRRIVLLGKKGSGW